MDHAGILADRDKGTGQAANVVGGHHAALLHSIVQQGKAGGGAAAAAGLQTHLFQNVGHTVADGRGGSQRKVDDTGGHAQCLGGKVCHQLTYAGDLEGGALDQLCYLVDGGILGQACQRGTHSARAGNAHMDLAVRLAGAVESTGHEGVILRGIAEHHQLGSADALTVGGQLAGFLYGLAHQLDGVHVQTGLGGTDVYRAAHDVGLGQCAGDGLDQAAVTGRKALVHQCAVAAHKVDAHLFAGGVQRFCKVHGVCVRAGTQQHGNGGNADALVDDGDTVLGADVLHGGDKVRGLGGDLVVDVLAGLFGVRVDAVQQADAHGHGAHVQIILREHLDGFQDIPGVKHTHSGCGLLSGSDGVHGVKNFLTGHVDLHPHLGGKRIGALVQLVVVNIAVGKIHQHDHGKHPLQDALGHILDIDVQLGAQTGHLCDNAHGIVSNDGNESFHGFHPRFPYSDWCRQRPGTRLPFQYSRFSKF